MLEKGVTVCEGAIKSLVREVAREVVRHGDYGAASWLGFPTIHDPLAETKCRKRLKDLKGWLTHKKEELAEAPMAPLSRLIPQNSNSVRRKSRNLCCREILSPTHLQSPSPPTSLNTYVPIPSSPVLVIYSPSHSARHPSFPVPYYVASSTVFCHLSKVYGSPIPDPPSPRRILTFLCALIHLLTRQNVAGIRELPLSSTRRADGSGPFSASRLRLRPTCGAGARLVRFLETSTSSEKEPGLRQAIMSVGPSHRMRWVLGLLLQAATSRTSSNGDSPHRHRNVLRPKHVDDMVHPAGTGPSSVTPVSRAPELFFIWLRPIHHNRAHLTAHSPPSPQKGPEDGHYCLLVAAIMNGAPRLPIEQSSTIHDNRRLGRPRKRSLVARTGDVALRADTWAVGFGHFSTLNTTKKNGAESRALLSGSSEAAIAMKNSTSAPWSVNSSVLAIGEREVDFDGFRWSRSTLCGVPQLARWSSRETVKVATTLEWCLNRQSPWTDSAGCALPTELELLETFISVISYVNLEADSGPEARKRAASRRMQTIVVSAQCPLSSLSCLRHPSSVDTLAHDRALVPSATAEPLVVGFDVSSQAAVRAHVEDKALNGTDGWASSAALAVRHAVRRLTRELIVAQRQNPAPASAVDFADSTAHAVLSLRLYNQDFNDFSMRSTFSSASTCQVAVRHADRRLTLELINAKGQNPAPAARVVPSPASNGR
ncbi:hypothetical protein BDK51DRAFT_44023 [Blyttiomyces helicus]|uniref:Uncharacterized protein n=1 Tax=Blyttiomyces helicus TaxID=388810 RepID=A0A4P9WLS8_9FUNG|nr:hypothetical protein BDK51DRAFT_44023 [Blyttiomyces helicus]|eukprot:RKO93372.1 hypothetical protein BDK51DRAFT_44023 [Blyttiomyces helicus]